MDRLLGDAIAEALNWIQIPLSAEAMNADTYDLRVWEVIAREAEFGSGPTSTVPSQVTTAPSVLLQPDLPASLEELTTLPGVEEHVVMYGYRRHPSYVKARRCHVTPLCRGSEQGPQGFRVSERRFQFAPPGCVASKSPVAWGSPGASVVLGFWNSSIRGRVQQSVCSHDGLNIFSVAGCGTLILALQKTLLERCGPKTATGLHLDAMLLPTLLQFFAIVAVAPGTCERPQNASSPFSPAATSMVYRPLGYSGLRVSAVSYGAWLTVDMLRVAIRAGINFIDNAEVYGAYPGESERIMGQALEVLFEEGEVRRSDLVISTKLFDGGDGINDRGLSRKHLVEGMQASLRRMKLGYVDLVFCHRPDVTTPMEETVRGMNYLLDRGWALYWGTSEWSAAQVLHAHSVAKELGLQGPLMEQPLYNLFNRQRVEIEFAPLYGYGLGLTVYSPLAEGILAGRYSSGIPTDSRAAVVERKASLARQERQIAAAEALRPIAKELHCSLAQLALAWVLSNGNVSTAIIGASKPSQVLDNVAAIACLSRFGQDTIQKILSTVSNAGAAPEMETNDDDISARMAAKKLQMVEFLRPELKDLKVLGTSFDEDGKDSASWLCVMNGESQRLKEFASVIEGAAGLPWFGVQFHPEKNAFEHGLLPDGQPATAAKHGPDAIATTQFFANFFVQQARLSSQSFPSEAEEASRLIYGHQTSRVFQPYFDEVYLFSAPAVTNASHHTVLLASLGAALRHCFQLRGKALVSPGSSPSLQRQELNAPSSWQSPSGCSPHQQGREDLMQPVRRARSAGRSAGPAAADANKVSATTRRDSPVRHSSPQDRAGGAKPRRASPQRKKGAAREASRSPEPPGPRARPPMAAPVQVQVAPPEKAGSTGSPPPGATESAPSFVKSLARLALVLESNGHSGTGAAAAAAAVAAAVTKQNDCEWMSDFEEYLQEGLERRPLQQEAATAGQEADALRARCTRLEHEAPCGLAFGSFCFRSFTWFILFSFRRIASFAALYVVSLVLYSLPLSSELQVSWGCLHAFARITKWQPTRSFAR
eukprot:s4417_g12.t1